MRRLRLRSVCAVDPGLTDSELDRIEQEFGFRFAVDHRAFLSAGLPVNTRPEPREPGVIYTHPKPWPDWRNGDRDKLRSLLYWPCEGVLFDVENNGFWHNSWGSRPSGTASALATATRSLAQVPKMVPVYGHRYLPGESGAFGHPVLSMWQTDIIYYGLHLADYVDREFGNVGVGKTPWEPKASVEFWRDLVC
ncbi:hypothetical protein O7621_06825 [Solwaraspora sp. WMMD937]|uniref:hypothetical protein n=1 Tax=Solwaraspora sp. WMMD937 TaxID=3016090 RepID=UPI00249BAF2A|nr:hypothetical protein [Solwaraspora sp. WMMD937]WFE24417.1 hypothetical protein O7621_06825 [Solwaraspora sp. WMMD937]